MAKEPFLTVAGLCDELTAHGIKGYPLKVNRWMKRGMPHHRPQGPRGRPYFLWSEVDAWIRSKWFDRPPGEGDGDDGAAA